MSDDESTRSSRVIDDATPPSPPVLFERPRRRSVSPPSTPAPPKASLLVEETPVLVEEGPRPVEGESWGTWGSLKKKGKKVKKASIIDWDEEPRKASDEDGWPASEPPVPQPETVVPAVAQSWGFAEEIPAPALKSGWGFGQEHLVADPLDLTEDFMGSGKKYKKKGKKPAPQPDEVYVLES